MDDGIFVFIDGESHYHRSEEAWQSLHGPSASLADLRPRGQLDGRLVLVERRTKVFWTKRMSAGAKRYFYLTACTGDDGAVRAAMQQMRDFDLEPTVFKEHSSLAKQRDATRRTAYLIETAKRVDIALVVLMLKAARERQFRECHLYTSDVDFAPAIEAVRAMGAFRVTVFGYDNGLGDKSELRLVCDQFVDLASSLRDDYELITPDRPQVGGAS